MALEFYSKEEMLDTMHKLIEEQRHTAQAALEEHRQATRDSLQEHHRSLTEVMNEIRADLGDIQLRLERGASKAAAVPVASLSSPHPTPRDAQCCPHGRGDDKQSRGRF
jgi:phosphoenolpyruvate-protein kinase (PTS system EI component)